MIINASYKYKNANKRPNLYANQLQTKLNPSITGFCPATQASELFSPPLFHPPIRREKQYTRPMRAELRRIA